MERRYERELIQASAGIRTVIFTGLPMKGYALSATGFFGLKMNASTIPATTYSMTQ